MTSNEIICWIMWAKQYGLEEAGITIPYFTKEDEEAILSWSPADASLVLRDILNCRKDIIDSDTCPFCHKDALECSLNCSISDMCENCSYAKRHKQCHNKNSTYKKILEKISEISPCTDSVIELLTESYILWILKEARHLNRTKNQWEYVK